MNRIEPVFVSGNTYDYHLGEMRVGKVMFRFSGRGEVALGYGERREEMEDDVQPDTTWYRRPRDRFQVEGGEVELVSSGRRAFRHLRVEVLEGDARLESVRVESSDSAPRVCRRFQHPDPLLMGIWEISTRTTGLCMRAYYEDGVKRDGLLWIGDCRVQYLCNLGPFGDHALMRKSLRMIAGSQFPDGSIPACASAGGGHRHPDAGYVGDEGIDYMPGIPKFPSAWRLQNYMWDFVSMVREYVDHSGDVETGREMTEPVLGVMSWLREHGDPAVARPFHDYFTDNGITVNGTMFAEPRMLRAYGICSCADARWLAERVRSERLAGMAEEMERWLRGMVLPEGRPSWHCASWERMAGLISSGEFLEVLRNPEALRPRTGYMWYWCLEALCREGEVEEALGWVRRIWGTLVENGFETCPETLFEDMAEYGRPGSALSYCHGWSAGPNALFWKYLPEHFSGT